jgi:hypothetical protein
MRLFVYLFTDRFCSHPLIEEENLELFAAYGEVYQRHHAARPHHELCISLSEYFGKPLDLLEVHDGLKDARRDVDEAKT